VSADDIKERAPRRDKKLEGFARRSGREVEPALFENVSDGGCRIVGNYKIGEWLVVMIPTLGTMQAQVRWSIGGRAGLQLEASQGAAGKGGAAGEVLGEA
jgi:hypothetical protein